MWTTKGGANTRGGGRVEGLEKAAVTTKHFYCGLFRLFRIMVTF
jgi:hypothetical protein